MVKTIAIIIASVIALTFIVDWVKGTPDPIIREITVQTKVDTTEILKKYASTLKPKIYKKTVIDTIRTTETDTLWLTTYVAQADTTFEDSTATVNVEFHSPIPLSNLAFFKLDVTVKELTINTNTETTITVEHQPNWFERFLGRFGAGVQVGIGYGFKSRDIQPYVGVGFTFKL